MPNGVVAMSHIIPFAGARVLAKREEEKMFVREMQRVCYRINHATVTKSTS